MCYNIAYIERLQSRIAERYKEILPNETFELNLPEDFPTYYFVSGFSHPLLPIVKHDGIFLYEWGLIPAWIKNVEMANDIRTKTLNAMAETVFEKPSFKKSIASQRCLLAVSGFYEWRTINKDKYPYFIKTKRNEIFSLGCIYETWVDKNTGEIRNTFSILTTPANELMQKIHNLKKRMPLILRMQDEKKWIDPISTKDEINLLMKPYSDEDMVAYPVSKSVNSARNNRNVPESMVEVEYNELKII